MRAVKFFLAALAGLCLCAAGSAQQAQAPPQPQQLDNALQIIRQYRNVHGDTPEALEALSRVARAELAIGNWQQAADEAQDILRSCRPLLATRGLDAEPKLPLAVGAAYEVEAQVLNEEHKRAAAIQLLRAALRTWSGTSIIDRLQKNLNLLTLDGRPAPLLTETQWIGSKPTPWSALRGKVVLLFFWAHWCEDCKVEAPVIAKLASDLDSKGLVIVEPTRLYGYTAQDEHAPPAEELAYTKKVYELLYAGIPNAGVPLNATNFERFGASTIPTLVLIDREGIVKLYHPGVMDEAALRAAIEPLLKR